MAASIPQQALSVAARTQSQSHYFLTSFAAYLNYFFSKKISMKLLIPCKNN